MTQTAERLGEGSSQMRGLERTGAGWGSVFCPGAVRWQAEELSSVLRDDSLSTSSDRRQSD